MAMAPSKLRVDAGSALLSLLAIQFAAQPFFTKACIGNGVLKSSLVLGTEALKVVACMVMLFLEGNATEVLRQWSFKGFLFAAGAPSVTYLVQNFCVQIAYQELDAVVFNVLNQTKMLSTAFFVYAIAGRGQSRIQCMALMLVTAAGILISTGDTSPGSSDASASSGFLSRGLGAMLLGTSLSGFGAGITEWIIRDTRRNNYLLSAEMALVGCILVMSSLVLGLTPDAEASQRDGLFAHWDAWTFVPVFTQALGGILVGLITKVAGSVKKSFATIAGIILTCVIRGVATSEMPSLSTCIAVPLAAGSIYLHTSYPLQKVTPK